MHCLCKEAWFVPSHREPRSHLHGLEIGRKHYHECLHDQNHNFLGMYLDEKKLWVQKVLHRCTSNACYWTKRTKTKGYLHQIFVLLTNLELNSLSIVNTWSGCSWLTSTKFKMTFRFFFLVLDPTQKEPNCQLWNLSLNIWDQSHWKLDISLSCKMFLTQNHANRGIYFQRSAGQFVCSKIPMPLENISCWWNQWVFKWLSQFKWLHN